MSIFRRLMAIVVSLAVIITAGPATASADATLCSSYDTCTQIGRTTHDYPAHSSTSYWSMTPGHNCTNYVAYILSSAGTPAPGYNLGNASNWSTAARAHGIPVDTTPLPGGVAWWPANTGGAGTYGHVAYVESVDASSVTVSEDNSPAGPYRWRVINRSSASWPAAFIHFPNPNAPQPILTAVQPISVGPSDHVVMYTPLNWSYRVRNTSGAPTSIQRIEVAVRGPSGNALDTVCANGNGLTLTTNQEWTCDATLPTGYGQTGTYRFWADWLDHNGTWHTGELGPQHTLTVQ